MTTKFQWNRTQIRGWIIKRKGPGFLLSQPRMKSFPGQGSFPPLLPEKQKSHSVFSIHLGSEWLSWFPAGNDRAHWWSWPEGVSGSSVDHVTEHGVGKGWGTLSQGHHHSPFPFSRDSHGHWHALTNQSISGLWSHCSGKSCFFSTSFSQMQKREAPPHRWRKTNDRDSKSEGLSGKELEGGPCHWPFTSRDLCKSDIANGQEKERKTALGW